MKYSDGFFVFRTENLGTLSLHNIPNVEEKWIHQGKIDVFDSYTYYWLVSDQERLKSEFHEAPIWVNSAREIIVIFLNDYNLISEVINATSRKFGVFLYPYSLAKRTTIMNDGNLVVTNKGINNTFNKIKTTLLKNDQQRISVIESIIEGE